VASAPLASSFVTAPPHQQAFLEALDAVRQALDEIEAPSMIIGGVAVIALGVPRLTVDIDATVAAVALDLERLVDLLGRHGIHARIPDALAFARAQQVFLCVHEASGTPVDISLAWLPFEDDALRLRQTCDYAGVPIHVPRPEDLLIYKLIAARPRDIEDAEGLLVLHAAAIDVGRVREVVGQFAAVLDDLERPQTLERLIRKAGL
jgi:hypothetical protein